MGEDDLKEAMHALQGTPAPRPDLPPPPEPLPPPQDETPAPDAAFAAPAAGAELVTEPPSVEGGPVWTALRALNSLLSLLPPTPRGHTRLGQCVAIMRADVEKDLFPEVVADRPGPDAVRPIISPPAEVNQAVEAAKSIILGLLPSVDIEKRLRDRLASALRKPSPFLEPDDRGTIEGAIHPTGSTPEKERNNIRLDALAVFLDALRRQPFAAVRYAVQILNAVAIPPDVLSVNLAENTVTFRGSIHKASDLTCCFVSLLIAAGGKFVSSTDVGKALQERGLWEGGQIRTDRLQDKLPKGLQDAIVTDRRGSRLDVDRLLSHV